MDEELTDLRQAREDYDQARTRLFDLIRAKLADGYGPSAVARASGYTREYIAKVRDGKVKF